MLNSDELINKVKSYNKFLNPETLSKAYDFAVKVHKDQKRQSGDPYVIHPVAVANILTELKLDSATISTLSKTFLTWYSISPNSTRNPLIFT